MRIIQSALVVFFISVFVGCATTPKEAAFLSEELGGMIRSSENSHLALVEEYIGEKKIRVDQFLNEKWFPDFMKTFAEDSGFEKRYQEAQGSEAKLTLVRQFSEAASQQLNKRRQAMFDSLDTLQGLLQERLQEHYGDMRITNETLTAHLRAAGKATATRDDLLKRLKVPTKQLLPLEKLNGAVDKMVGFQGKLEDLTIVVNEAKSIIKEELPDGK